MGESGSVGWMFDKKGYIVVDKADKSEDELFEIAVGAGADDMQDEGDVFEIFTSPDNFEAVNDAIKSAGINPQAAEISMVPQNYIALTGQDAKTMMKLYDALDDNDDVQKVYANFDIDESELE
jgi:transcriptional/translational regulatory protein YebC/TACO1